MAKKRITLDIEQPLLDRIDQAAAAAAVSRSRFIADAVVSQVQEIERRRIDQAFEEMGRDPERRLVLVGIEHELAPASDALMEQLYDEERREGRTYDPPG